MTSFSVVSEIAIVPESEWRMPTLIVSSAESAGAMPASGAARPSPAATAIPRIIPLSISMKPCLLSQAAA